MSALYPHTRRERVELATALRAEGLTYREIASRIGCTPSTARSLVTDPAGAASWSHRERVYVPAEPILLTHDALDVPALVALAELTPAEREAFIDNAMLGHSFAEIGSRVGASRSAVSKNAERARLKLAEVLFPSRREARTDARTG